MNSNSWSETARPDANEPNARWCSVAICCLCAGRQRGNGCEPHLEKMKNGTPPPVVPWLGELLIRGRVNATEPSTFEKNQKWSSPSCSALAHGARAAGAPHETW